MDYSNPKVMQVFFDLYNELPRGGPGSRDTTMRAFYMCRELPPIPRTADLGCGPGPQTLDLALCTNAKVTAIDRHPVFIRRLKERARNARVLNRINAVVGDMGNLPFVHRSLDLIWSEGAAYFLGIENALNYFRDFLKPGGYLAFSEAVKLTERFSPAMQKMWEEEYPDITTIDENLGRASRAGYSIEGHFVIPPKDWLVEYYAPLLERAQLLKQQYGDNRLAQDVLDECIKDAHRYEEYGDEYGYLFLVLRK